MRAANCLVWKNTLPRNGKIVRNAEGSGYTVRRNSCQVLVTLVVHDSDESDVPVLDDDVDGGYGSHLITLQRRFGINLVIGSAPDLIVVGRKGEDFYLVVDTLNAFYSL